MPMHENAMRLSNYVDVVRTFNGQGNVDFEDVEHFCGTLLKIIDQQIEGGSRDPKTLQADLTAAFALSRDEQVREEEKASAELARHFDSVCTILEKTYAFNRDDLDINQNQMGLDAPYMRAAKCVKYGPYDKRSAHDHIEAGQAHKNKELRGIADMFAGEREHLGNARIADQCTRIAQAAIDATPKMVPNILREQASRGSGGRSSGSDRSL